MTLTFSGTAANLKANTPMRFYHVRAEVAVTACAHRILPARARIFYRPKSRRNSGAHSTGLKDGKTHCRLRRFYGAPTHRLNREKAGALKAPGGCSAVRPQRRCGQVAKGPDSGSSARCCSAPRRMPVDGLPGTFAALKSGLRFRRPLQVCFSSSRIFTPAVSAGRMAAHWCPRRSPRFAA